jgi:hypothetical protein
MSHVDLRASGEFVQMLSLLTDVVFTHVAKRWRDTDGRPAGAEVFAEDFDTSTDEYISCPYAGIRKDHPLPMNLTALRQIKANWDEMMASIDWMRARYLEWTARPYMNGLDAVCLSHAVIAMPSYLFHRARNAVPNGRLPAFVSGNAKAYAANFTMFVKLLEQATVGPSFAVTAAQEPSADQILTLAEMSKDFIGIHGVCAGPPQLVKESIVALISGAPKYRDHLPAVQSWFDELPALLRFSDAKLILLAQIQRLRLASLVALMELRAHLDLDAGPAEAMNAWAAFLQTTISEQIKQGRFSFSPEVPLPTLMALLEQTEWMIGYFADARRRSTKLAELIESAEAQRETSRAAGQDDLADLIARMSTLLEKSPRWSCLGEPARRQVAGALARYLIREASAVQSFQAFARDVMAALGREALTDAASKVSVTYVRAVAAPTLPDALDEFLGAAGSLKAARA